MERFKEWISRHKRLCILAAAVVLLAITAVVGIVFAVRPGDSRPVQAALQEASEQDLQTLQEAGILSGVQDRTVEVGEAVRLCDLVTADSKVVTGVEVHDSGVDYGAVGEYPAVYTITFDGDTLNRFLQERDLSLSFDTDADVIQVQATVTITVTESQTTSGTASSTSASQTEVGSTESPSTQAGSQASSSTSASASRSPDSGVSSGSGTVPAAPPTTTAHQHNWQAHEVWVSDIVTVVDEPERTVQGARLYTQNADGTWTSNGETYWFEDGFTVEDLKEILEDKIKNEGYIGNCLNVKKTIPAVTHTEDHGSYQVDYYYCSCGATKR